MSQFSDLTCSLITGAKQRRALPDKLFQELH